MKRLIEDQFTAEARELLEVGRYHERKRSVRIP